MPGDPSSRAEIEAARRNTERALLTILAGASAPPRGPIDSTHTRDDHGDMEERLRKVEDAVVRIDATLSQLATKADVSEVKGQVHAATVDIIKWVVGTAAVLGAAAITVMTFVLNHATPKQPASPQTIYVPVPAPPAIAPPQAPIAPPPAQPK